MVDVLVAGSGPAGWSVASACARLGLSTALVAPRPAAVWPATYGMWADEVGALPAGSRYVTARPRGMARDYVVLDNSSVLAAFRDSGVRMQEGMLAAAPDARVVIDATGSRRVGGVEQSAFGVVVPAAVAEPIVGPGEAVFMDWRGHTFLYAVPLPDGRVLLEETSLARRPGLGMRDLQARLHARLADHGMSLTDWRLFSMERVRFALDARPPSLVGRGAIPFGAAAGFVHPATGFSVADSFRLAPKVAHAIAANISRGAVAVNIAARQAMWPPAARIVHRLRRRGLSTLLALAPEQLPAFFDLFFALPPERQRAYLSGREDVLGTAAAMAALYRAAPRSLRRVLLGLGQTGESERNFMNSR